MRLFLSYARHDREVVAGLVSDLQRSGHDVWIDREISGGQRWWEALLEQIRGCDVAVLALSPSSAVSRACRAELAYAVALQRPILPVMLHDTNVELAPNVIGTTQIVDYRLRSSENAIALISALSRLQLSPVLPAPLPLPPPPPITDLGPARETLVADSLSYAEQEALLGEFRRGKDEGDQHDTLRALLVQFRQRGDIIESIGRGVDALLATLPSDNERDETVPRSRRPIDQRDPDSIDRLRSLLTHARSGHFVPIVGHGVNDRLIGSPHTIAREWSRAFEFPMAKHQHDALPDVAQFIAVMTNVETLRSSLGEYLLSRLRVRYPEVGQAGDGLLLSDALQLAWQTDRSSDDPNVVLAQLPCRIYINANPWGLLSEALREAGRSPVTDVCRWRADVYDWPGSIFAAEPDYVPTVERPLVFHVFGSLAAPDSLVLTQDDFDDFQIAIAENRSLIPAVVQRVLANSAILLLGFELEERDVRVLMRSLIGQEGAHKMNKYTHVAAQLELSGAVTSPARAQRYMERYFAKFHQPSIDIFWGTVEEFAADLAQLWKAGR